MKTLIGAALVVAAAIGSAPQAHADDFTVCGMGYGAGGSTTCAFANNVGMAYLSQPGSLVIAYSPVTGEAYEMQCNGGYTVNLGIATKPAVRCAGGNNAVVWLW